MVKIHKLRSKSMCCNMERPSVRFSRRLKNLPPINVKPLEEMKFHMKGKAIGRWLKAKSFHKLPTSASIGKSSTCFLGKEPRLARGCKRLPTSASIGKSSTCFLGKEPRLARRSKSIFRRKSVAFSPKKGKSAVFLPKKGKSAPLPKPDVKLCYDNRREQVMRILNDGSIHDIAKLCTVGGKSAQQIYLYRQCKGSFQDLSDLLGMPSWSTTRYNKFLMDNYLKCDKRM